MQLEPPAANLLKRAIDWFLKTAVLTRKYDPRFLISIRLYVELMRKTHLLTRSVISLTSRSFGCGGCAPPAAAFTLYENWDANIRVKAMNGISAGDLAML